MANQKSFGDFEVGTDFSDLVLEQLNEDDELFNIFISEMPTLTECEEMPGKLDKPEEVEVPTDVNKPELDKENLKPGGRWCRTVNETDLHDFEDSHQSKRTKKNTMWALKIFQDWHTARHGQPLDTSTVEAEDLGNLLRTFYCEMSPRDAEKRSEQMGSVGKFYHKNTIKNIRSALNRHLSDIGRRIDIVHDKDFKSANNTLDGFLEEQTRSGNSRATTHKAIIEKDDIDKIAEYFSAPDSNPIILRQYVWFCLGIHFVSRGQEFHHQLTQGSFNFNEDGDGTEFVTLNHETQQKNFQGGISGMEAPSDRRMYATGEPNCPVGMLKLLMKRTKQPAESLFNCCSKQALSVPCSNDVWYDNKCLSARAYLSFMADICKSSGTSKTYTAHSLRATAITAMNDEGFDTRHIMFMSGHRNEKSVRSYCKEPSVQQKKHLSSTLSSLTVANRGENQRKSMKTATTSVDSTSDNVKTVSNEITGLVNPLFQSGSFSGCSFNITIQK